MVAAVVAAHAALLGLAFRGPLSVVLVAGFLGLFALKYIWWKRRR